MKSWCFTTIQSYAMNNKSVKKEKRGRGIECEYELMETTQELTLHQLVRQPMKFREDRAPCTLHLVFCRYENDMGSICISPPNGEE